MPRFFFDEHDSIVTHDETGTELSDIQAVRKTAMGILPKIAADELPIDGDRRFFMVLVKDAEGRPVYSATLSYAGMWLGQH